MKIPQSWFLENHLENQFRNIFLSFKNSLLGYNRSNFQKESPGGYCQFQCF